MKRTEKTRPSDKSQQNFRKSQANKLAEWRKIKPKAFKT